LKPVSKWGTQKLLNSNNKINWNKNNEKIMSIYFICLRLASKNGPFVTVSMWVV